MPKLAGVLLLGTGGIIKEMSTEHMETACRISEDKILHPFAFRTHTHQLGKLINSLDTLLFQNKFCMRSLT